MALQMGALRDALLDAGADPDKAARAAEEMAGYENEFADVRGAIADGFKAVDARFAEVDLQFERVRGELNLHRWMLASIFALLLAVALKIFLH